MDVARNAVLVAATAVIVAFAVMVARAELTDAPPPRARRLVEIALPVAGLAWLLVAAWGAVG